MNALGIDTSHWQGNVKWGTASARGIVFAYLKCTDGIKAADDCYAANWIEAGNWQILRGAYHWYRPGLNPMTQARWFCDNTLPGELPLAADVEDSAPFIPSATVALIFNKAMIGAGLKVRAPAAMGTVSKTYADALWLFLDELCQATGKKPVIYTALAYWETRLQAAAALWADAFPLWIANYRKDAGPLVPLPWCPTNWTFWQFATAKGYGPKYGTNPITSKDIDLDVYNGDVVELAAWAKR